MVCACRRNSQAVWAPRKAGLAVTTPRPGHTAGRAPARRRLLLLLPLVAGLPVLAWLGVLDSAPGLLAGTAVVGGLVYAAEA